MRFTQKYSTMQGNLLMEKKICIYELHFDQKVGLVFHVEYDLIMREISG